jgi:hypothetical protein
VVVTKEVSAPTKKGANSKIPDVIVALKSGATPLLIHKMYTFIYRRMLIAAIHHASGSKAA